MKRQVKSKILPMFLMLTLLSVFLLPIANAASETKFYSQELTNNYVQIESEYPYYDCAVGQTFMITDARYYLTVASFNLSKEIEDVGPNGTLVAQLYAVDDEYCPTGDPLAESDEVIIEDLLLYPSWAWTNFTFSAPLYTIQKDIEYAICVVCTSGEFDASDAVLVADYDVGIPGQYELWYEGEEPLAYKPGPPKVTLMSLKLQVDDGGPWYASEYYCLQFRLYGEQLTSLSAYPMAVQTIISVLLPILYLIGVSLIFIQDRGKITAQNIIGAAIGFLVIGILFPLAMGFLIA